jgi:hypothetical protein
MSKKKNIRMPKLPDKGVFACDHLYEKQSLELGFYFPECIENDLVAWCGQCEEKLIKEGGWTKNALKYADFAEYSSVCLLLLRDNYVEKIQTGKPGKYKIWD